MYKERGMYMVNFKTRLGVSVILAAMLLSGCQTRNESSQSESSGISSAQSNESSSVSSSGTDESSIISSAQAPIINSTVDTPKYNNTLNIGEIEIAKDGAVYDINIPPLFEMSRDEVLEHFGLNTDFDLSGAVPELYETMPKNRMLNTDGKHGLCRMCTYYENGDCVWGDVRPWWDNDEFCFESADGSHSATVIFQRKYINYKYVNGAYMDFDVVSDRRSGIYTFIDGSFSTEPFYALSPSIIAGVEMRIAKRSIGGYYAEFGTDSLCVGLIAEGLSEEKTIAILEYLAEYVGAANASESNDIRVETYDVSDPYPLVPIEQRVR